MAVDNLRITEIARRAAIRPSAIRYYEKVGLLPPPARINGIRRYEVDVLRRLAVIATAQRMGFTISEIGTLLNGFDADTPAWSRWQMLAHEKLPEIDALIRNAQGMKRLLEASLACDCLTLEECADALQLHLGGAA